MQTAACLFCLAEPFPTETICIKPLLSDTYVNNAETLLCKDEASRSVSFRQTIKAGST